MTTPTKTTKPPVKPSMLWYEQELALAKIRRELAEASKLEHEAEIARHEAQQASITTLDYEQADKFKRASDEYNHIYRFSGAVTGSSVVNCQGTLARWSRLNPEAAFTIVFNSPGGSVIDGMALWDYLTELKEHHHLTTVCRGMAASMGGILLQAGHVRKMGRESYILIHEVSAGTGGKIGEMEDDIAFYKKMCERVVNLFVERSDGKLTKQKLTKNWSRKDWWIASDEALELGLVDEVI